MFRTQTQGALPTGGAASIVPVLRGRAQSTRAIGVPWAALTTVLVLLITIVGGFFLPFYVVIPAATLLAAAAFLRVERGSAVRIWAVYLVGVLLFSHLRAFADGAGMPVQTDYVVTLEKAIFGGGIPTVWLQEQLYTLGNTGPLEWLALGTHVSFFMLPLTVAAVIWRAQPEGFRPFVSAMLLTVFIALPFFVLLPTAPPWIAAQQGDIAPVLRLVALGFTDISSDAFATANEVVGDNPVAAMPSLHMGVAVLVALAAWRGPRPVALIGAAYPVLMAFALMYTGEHWGTDLIAGTLIAVIAWKIAHRMGRGAQGEAGSGNVKVTEPSQPSRSAPGETTPS